MKIILRNLKVFTFLLFFSGVLFAPDTRLWAQNFTQEERDFIAGNPQITLAYVGGRPPYSYFDAAGSLQGISVDIMSIISEISGLQFTYEVLEKGVRTLDFLTQNPTALVVGVLHENSDFHQPSYVLSDPYYSDVVSLVALKNRSFDALSSSVSYRMVLPKSYAALDAFICQNYPLFTILYCQDVEEGLKMVNDGKADFMAQNMSVILSQLTRPQYNRLTLLPSLIMDENMSVVGLASLENQLIISIINKCIAVLSHRDVSEIVLNHTMATTYRLGFADVLYQYRGELMIILLLLVVISGFVSYSIKTRDKQFDEIDKMNTRLTFAMEQANEAALVKTRFLQRISHDIRTPMNAIVGALDSAEVREQREDLSLDERLEIIKNIRSATFDMEKLVEDIISRTNVLEGNLELQSEVFNLKSKVEKTSEELQMAVSGRVNWVSSVIQTPETYDVSGDLGKYDEIIDLLNELIICFPYPLRSISFFADCLDFDDDKVYSHIKISLVSAVSIDALYENDPRRIPLMNLSDLMGGAASFNLYNDIRLDISVTLPFQKTVKEGKKTVDGEREAITSLLNFKTDKDIRFLVIDDNEINVEILTHLLSAGGIVCDSAGNGRDGVKLFCDSEPGRYKAVVMDIRMPVMNGNDATREIRNSGRTDARTVPIIAFSANYATTDISTSINAGVNGYLKKPLEVQKLVQMLNTL